MDVRLFPIPLKEHSQSMASPRPTLLILDDEPEVLRSLYDLFRLDYKVATFSRGADALAAIESGSLDPAVVMSDQRMPEMTGVEFLGRVRELRPDATRLLITGYAEIKAVIDAINTGSVYRYIGKPWDPEELDSIVRQAVEQHELILERNRLMAELRVNNQKLDEANRLKGAFIEVASHELNTPVAIVLGMAELWKLTQSAVASPAERGWVERIQGAGRRLAGTVERMLKLLHADQFDHPLDLREAELEPIIRRTVADLEPFWNARRQTLDIQIAPGLGSALVDAPKLGDILANLIVNAIKFTPDGKTIVIAGGPDGVDRVRFSVRDPGVGIAQEECLHMFEPFFTGYDTLHHSSGEFQFCKRGIGLGLHLVKTFAELHGGTVECLSEPDRGSTFSVTLPRRAAVSAKAS